MKTMVYRTVVVNGEVRQRIAAIVTVDVTGSIRVDEYGDGRYTKDILSRIVYLPDGSVVTKDDGVAFLKALPYAYSGTRVRAMFLEE